MGVALQAGKCSTHAAVQQEAELEIAWRLPGDFLQTPLRDAGHV